ncbi:MAG: Zn-dependent exopeptidase M28 [Bacteroidia bacterium]|nr:Zn-dependent exopeptidase M28 [Bacteroidia bacterium]
MRAGLFLFAFLLSFIISFAQDTVYARQVIKYLCSEKCYGRGYLKNGLQNAEKFIVSEIKKNKALPLFSSKYTQFFRQAVNTFPGKCELTVNGKVLIPGKDFIPDPRSLGAKGTFKLTKVDSVHYISAEGATRISVNLKKKLTYSVAGKMTPYCSIEIDQKNFTEEPKELVINLENKFITDFESRNIGCYVNGTQSNDSMIIFSAHYDHLGGIGKKTFFPGANDNASGTSVVLNLLKYYSAHPPKYKTVFIFFAAEEAGLLGSKHFVDNSPIDLKKIKFLINLDLLGTGDDGIMVVNGAVFEKEFSKLMSINAEQHLVKEIKKRGKASNSDHYWFSEAGVPCFFIYTMGGVTFYHDVFDKAQTLPLTDYVDVFKLITVFANSF